MRRLKHTVDGTCTRGCQGRQVRTDGRTCHCNVNAQRQILDIWSSILEECRMVVETLGKVYEVESQCRKQHIGNTFMTATENCRANGVKPFSTSCRLPSTRRRYGRPRGDECLERMDRPTSMKSCLRLSRHPQNPERGERPALPTQKIHNFSAWGTLAEGTWCVGGFQNSGIGRRTWKYGVLRSINSFLSQTAPGSKFSTQAGPPFLVRFAMDFIRGGKDSAYSMLSTSA